MSFVFCLINLFMERLQKYIASCGVASRRKAEELITTGMIRVNGRVVTELGFKVDPERDSVKYNSRLLKREKFVYIVMNKPSGYVSTVSDDKGRNTVVELVKGLDARLFPVGRLDYNTTGALFLTNDGTWANSVMHPKFEISKKYAAKVSGRVGESVFERLKRGVKIDGGFVSAKEAGIYGKFETNDVVYVTITQGINHQVRKMLEAVGHPAVWLKRISVGPVDCAGLEYGQYRHLTETEIKYFLGVRDEKGSKRLAKGNRPDRRKNSWAVARKSTPRKKDSGGEKRGKSRGL
jgi:23S rRNA pseudouridine2605 synthase